MPTTKKFPPIHEPMLELITQAGEAGITDIEIEEYLLSGMDDERSMQGKRMAITYALKDLLITGKVIGMRLEKAVEKIYVASLDPWKRLADLQSEMTQLKSQNIGTSEYALLTEVSTSKATLSHLFGRAMRPVRISYAPPAPLSFDWAIIWYCHHQVTPEQPDPNMNSSCWEPLGEVRGTSVFLIRANDPIPEQGIPYRNVTHLKVALVSQGDLVGEWTLYRLKKDIVLFVGPLEESE